MIALGILSEIAFFATEFFIPKVKECELVSDLPRSYSRKGCACAQICSGETSTRMAKLRCSSARRPLPLLSDLEQS